MDPNFSVAFNEYFPLPSVDPKNNTSNLIKNSCPHASKVYLCMQLPKHDKNAQFMRSHISKCSHCFQVKEKITQVFSIIEKNIPKAQMQEYFQEEVNEEIQIWLNQKSKKNKTSLKQKLLIIFNEPRLQQILNSDWTKYFIVSFICFSLFKIWG